jgi:hypothetical protein
VLPTVENSRSNSYKHWPRVRWRCSSKMLAVLLAGLGRFTRAARKEEQGNEANQTGKVPRE